MSNPLSRMLNRSKADVAGIHPVDRGYAKHWIKRRLVAVYPSLGSDPHALEAAYRGLDLEPADAGQSEVPAFELSVGHVSL